MREIKCRAWDKFTSKFFYFSDGRYYDSVDLNHCVSERICSEFSWADSKQFTGLHDKNGKEIYEGDILKIKTSNTPFGVVEFSNGGFYVKTEHFKYTIFQHDIPVEIIGNIHENPELLK